MYKVGECVYIKNSIFSSYDDKFGQIIDKMNVLSVNLYLVDLDLLGPLWFWEIQLEPVFVLS